MIKSSLKSTEDKKYSKVGSNGSTSEIAESENCLKTLLVERRKRGDVSEHGSNQEPHGDRVRMVAGSSAM